MDNTAQKHNVMEKHCLSRASQATFLASVAELGLEAHLWGRYIIWLFGCCHISPYISRREIDTLIFNFTLVTSRLDDTFGKGEFVFVFDSAEGTFNRNIYSQYGADSLSLWDLPAASITHWPHHQAKPSGNDRLIHCRSVVFFPT